MGFVAIKLERDDYAGIFPVQEVESLGQDADDLSRFAVHEDIVADDGRIAGKFAAPIAVGKNGGFRSARGIILFCEGGAPPGGRAQEPEDPPPTPPGPAFFPFLTPTHAP